MPFPSRPLPVIGLRIHPSPHPFVRRGLVSERPDGLPATGLVSARGPDGETLGEGFWNGTSDIAFRRLSVGEAPFDEAALGAALERAVARRRRLPGLTAGDAWRVIHAEGDGLSGLIVDRYRDVLMVQFHSAGWLLLEEPLLAALHGLLGTRHHRVGLDERLARLEGVRPRTVVSAEAPQRLRIAEHGVRYAVDLAEGHKTGFFLDQRENRQRLIGLCRGASVLDLCCYTGAFGLAAKVAGGAEDLTGVDLDEQALEVARENAKLNQARARFVHADAFDWLRQIGPTGRRFDVVILDPPRLVAGRAEDADGRRRYSDLNRLAMGVVAPGGLLVTCSCSGALARAEFVEIVRSAGRRAGRQATILWDSGAAADHPVALECPETEYLKTLWLSLA